MTMTRKQRRLGAFVLALLLLFCLNCVGGGNLGAAGDSKEDGRGELVVAAAANLSEAFAEIGLKFERQTGIRVVNSFGATTDLARQIENGAPFDVFAAADVRHVEELERQGLIVAGTRRVYARGRLVLWVPPESRAAGLADLKELAAAGVSRVALPRPEAAPYGQAAVEALRALGLWERIEPKVVYAQNVAQARQFAATGNADAAFLPRSLVRGAGGSFREVEAQLHRPIEQAAGVVARSNDGQAANEFVEFLLSDEGRSILKEYGYDLP
jgi:molybdate transport system substrate-binding protein